MKAKHSNIDLWGDPFKQVDGFWNWHGHTRDNFSTNDGVVATSNVMNLIALPFESLPWSSCLWIVMSSVASGSN